MPKSFLCVSFEGDGGSPGRSRRDRRGLHRPDGEVHPLESGSGEPLQPLPALRGLFARRDARDFQDAVQKGLLSARRGDGGIPTKTSIIVKGTSK